VPAEAYFWCKCSGCSEKAEVKSSSAQFKCYYCGKTNVSRPEPTVRTYEGMVRVSAEELAKADTQRPPPDAHHIHKGYRFGNPGPATYARLKEMREHLRADWIHTAPVEYED
jgi:predicted RNA-binding Zn-ribbon protein involved in translation (DUF1610 family)